MNNEEIKTLIHFFTHNKSLTRQQIARRDMLLARDCGESTKRDSVPKNVEDTKKMAADSKDSKVLFERCLRPSIDKIKYLDPRNMHDFLVAFQGDQFLSDTCHPIDKEEHIKEICEACHTKSYDFEAHKDLINQSFTSLLKKYANKQLDNHVLNLMFAYLGGGKCQNETEQIIQKNGWGSDSLKDWAMENPSIIPNPGDNIASSQANWGYRLDPPLISDINGRWVRYFTDVNSWFKSYIRIKRAENPITELLTKANRAYEGRPVVIKFNEEKGMFQKNSELFINVRAFVRAYRSIVDMCLECHKNDVCNIVLSYYKENGYTYFCIHDINSMYQKTIEDALSRIGRSQRSLIKYSINGLCDLYLEADFGNGIYASLNLWDADKEFKPQRIDVMHGVKYIMRFPQ